MKQLVTGPTVYLLLAVLLVPGCNTVGPGHPINGECRIELKGYSKLEVDSVTADNLSIVVSEHGTIKINSMSSRSSAPVPGPSK